jgi:FkbM family methyltransferase
MLQLIRENLKNVRNYFTDAAYREALRIKRLCRLTPIRTPFATRIAGYIVHVHDSASLNHQYESIFTDAVYAFQSDKKEPVIYCCGANMGLELLAWKKQYPASRIVAFEADAAIFKVLQQNVNENALQNITLHNAAVWTANGTLAFEPDGQQGGRAGAGTKQVQAVALHELLAAEKEIDFLMIDIEGAELPVLQSCRDQLHKVKKLFVEWHSAENAPQQLPALLELLTSCGFRYRLQNKLPRAPFNNPMPENGFDAMTDIFAERTT